jgi:hypothetical protein
MLTEETGINGPIYSAFSAAVDHFHSLNLVEGFKGRVLSYARPGTDRKKRFTANIAIDIFVIAKWGFVLIAWAYLPPNPLILTVVAYLMIANLYTSFRYHLWVPTYDDSDIHRDRRRFLNLLLSLAFAVFAYAYLYDHAFHSHFDWPQNISPGVAALSFSAGNALTGTTGDLKAKTDLGYLLVTSQLVMTFIFVAILLGQSIPNHKFDKKEIG